MRNLPPAPHQRKLTERQKAVLLYGDSQGITGRGFINETEERGAWMRHRSELLAAAGSRGRPSGYLRFELCFETPSWIGDVATLLSQNELGNAALQAERRSIALQGDQPTEFNSEFLKPATIRALGMPTPKLESLAREFGNALAYHTFCRRPELIRKYGLIHAAIRAVLRETLLPLVPKKETMGGFIQ